MGGTIPYAEGFWIAKEQRNEDECKQANQWTSAFPVLCSSSIYNVTYLKGPASSLPPWWVVSQHCKTKAFLPLLLLVRAFSHSDRSETTPHHLRCATCFSCLPVLFCIN